MDGQDGEVIRLGGEDVFIPEEWVLDPRWTDDGGFCTPFGWQAKHLEDYEND